MKAATKLTMLQGLADRIPTFDPTWTSEVQAAWKATWHELNVAVLDALEQQDIEEKRGTDQQRIELLVIDELRRSGALAEIVEVIRKRVADQEAALPPSAP